MQIAVNRPRLGHLPILESIAQALHLDQLVPTAIARGDMCLERRALRRIDFAVKVGNEGFVAISRISTQNVSHNVLAYRAAADTPVRASSRRNTASP